MEHHSSESRSYSSDSDEAEALNRDIMHVYEYSSAYDDDEDFNMQVEGYQDSAELEDEAAEEEQSEQLPNSKTVEEKDKIKDLGWDQFNEFVLQKANQYPDLITKMAQQPLKHVPYEAQHMNPDSFKFDIDGLCIISQPRVLLSFIKNPLPNSEDMFICTNPRYLMKFTAGRHKFDFGSSKSKYGAGAVCHENNVFGQHRQKFVCFMKWMSWPIFFSCEDEEEKIAFWKTVLIPALEDTFPSLRRADRDYGLPAESYPWPSESTVKVSRSEFPTFSEALNRHASRSHLWDKILTMTIKFGQKSCALPGEDFFDATLGLTLQNFDLEGIHCLFWSNGINFEYPVEGRDEQDEARVGFWNTDFLERETRGQRRDRKVYYLMGTSSLAAAQVIGPPPQFLSRTWKALQDSAHTLGVDFDMESYQFYSTLIYMFKTTSIACNPTSFEWWNGSTALSWLLKLLGTKSKKDDDDPPGPLSKFIDFCSSLPAASDCPLRFEPTFYLRFGRGDRADQRLRALKTLYNQSASFVGDCLLDLLTNDSDECHTTCFLTTTLDRLSALATVYDVVARRIKLLAQERRFLSVHEGELLNFLEFSPYVWITGQKRQVCPKVMRTLDIPSAIHTYQWPALPKLLFTSDPFFTYRDVLTVFPTFGNRGRINKWLADNNFMSRVPQVWFQGRKHPSTKNMKNELSLLLEFETLLTSEQHEPWEIVYYFLVIFGYCCLVRSEVDVTKARKTARKSSEPNNATPPVINLRLVATQSDASDEESEEQSLEEPEEHEHSPMSRPASPLIKPLSLNEVKAFLLCKPGPLFKAIEKNSSNLKQPIPFQELLGNLFFKPNLLQDTSSYSFQLRDIWVPALKLIKLYSTSSNCPPAYRTLSTKHGVMDIILTWWPNIIPFACFWKCTPGKFAKSEFGLFPINYQASSFMDSALRSSSPASSLRSLTSTQSNGNNNNVNTQLSSQRSSQTANHSLENLFVLAATILKEKSNQAINEDFVSSSGDKQNGLAKSLKASVVIASQLSDGQIDGMSQNYRSKFAAYSALRLAYNAGTISFTVYNMVNKKFQKEVDKYKVSIDQLASWSPFFTKASPKKLIVKDKAYEIVDKLAQEYDRQANTK